MQKDEAISEESSKYYAYKEDLAKLESRLDEEKQNREKEHLQEVEKLNLKYEEKLNLYRVEIDRLNTQMDNLNAEIETKFSELSNEQSTYFNNIFKQYSDDFKDVQMEIETLYMKLINICTEYDEALDSAGKQYKEMEEQVKKREGSKKENIKEIKDKKEEEDKNIKNYSEQKETELKKCIEESNFSIRKNAEIKQNIIDTTQRTITLQEQLLETEKNLHKIEVKLQDLTVKNKHLEQMRFVLEHRMKSLEKEKAPLEGQCNFLVKQKQKLEDEFNKLTLQISLINQELESNQSQLKANLIQNFEIDEQLEYLKQKLTVIKAELFNFKETHKNTPTDLNDLLMKQGNVVGLNTHIFQQNKATYVALKLKEFYDKFFNSNINDELLNYKEFKKKLKEDTEKTNASSNHDLILRNKGEEKLKSEKEKLEQIKFQKEIGFKRMENENTILIAEANRLRKYLHEVYLRVVDIEKRFENLTHINPNLSKTEIVYQIKEFIKVTHRNIKTHFADKEKAIVIQEELEDGYNGPKYTDGADMYLNATHTQSMNTQREKKQSENLKILESSGMKANNYKKSEYEGLILPPINNN